MSRARYQQAMMTAEAFDIYAPVLQAPAPHLRLDPARIQWRNGMLLRTTNWLGDALMTLPATWRLSQAVPEGGATGVLCPAFLAPLWQAAPWIGDVIPLAGKRCGKPERQRLRALGPGVGVVLPNSFGSALDLCFAGIPLRLGRRGRGRSPLLTHRLPEWRRQPGMAPCHQLSHYLELAAVFGDVQPQATCPPLRLEEARETCAAVGVDISAGAWLVVAPGAAYGPAKQWPVERFIEVVQWWRRSVGPVAVVGTGKERLAGDAVRRTVPDAVNLAGRTDLTQLMAILQMSHAVLANDSGAMHLGGALGCRGVAVFGSTDPVATGPIGGRWILLHRPPHCAPCFERSCPRADSPYDCLMQIDSDTVVKALTHLLNKDTAGTPAGPNPKERQ